MPTYDETMHALNELAAAEYARMMRRHREAAKARLKTDPQYALTAYAEAMDAQTPWHFTQFFLAVADYDAAMRQEEYRQEVRQGAGTYEERYIDIRIQVRLDADTLRYLRPQERHFADALRADGWRIYAEWEDGTIALIR